MRWLLPLLAAGVALALCSSFLSSDLSSSGVRSRGLVLSVAGVPAAGRLGYDEDGAAGLLTDEDEFVGSEGFDDELTVVSQTMKPIDGQAAVGAKKAAAAQAAAPSPTTNDLHSPTVENVMARPASFFHPFGWPEYLGLAFIAAYILNYFVGVKANGDIAESFATAFRPLLEEQFAHFEAPTVDGSTPQAAAAFNYALLKESASLYRLYASGRRHVSSMMLTVNLRRRQDFFQFLAGFFDLAPTKDTVTLEFAMNEEECEPFLFALVKKQTLKAFQKQLAATTTANADAPSNASSGPSIESFLSQSKSTKSALTNAGYVVLNELHDLEADLLPERIVRLLTQPNVAKRFVELFITDQACVSWSTSKKLLRFVFELPSDWTPSGGGEEDTPLGSVLLLAKLAFHFVDRLGPSAGGDRIQLTGPMRTRSEAHRKKLAEVAAKQTKVEMREAVARRKQEQKEKERAIIAADPNSELARELLRKQEAKLAKAERKARQPRMIRS